MDQIHQNQEHFVSNEDMEMELSEMEVASMEHDYCLTTLVTPIPLIYNNKNEKITKINWLDEPIIEQEPESEQESKEEPENIVSHTIEIKTSNEIIQQNKNQKKTKRQKKINKCKNIKNEKPKPIIDIGLQKLSEMFNEFNKPISSEPNQKIDYEPYTTALTNNNNNPLKKKTFRNCNIIDGRIVISEEELQIYENIKSRITIKDFMRILIWKKFQYINNVCNFNITCINISNKNHGSYTLYAYCNFLSCNTFKVRCMKKKSGMVAIFYKSRLVPLHYENIPVTEQVRGLKKQLYGETTNSRSQIRGSVVKWNLSQIESNKKIDWHWDESSESSSSEEDNFDSYFNKNDNSKSYNNENKTNTKIEDESTEIKINVNQTDDCSEINDEEHFEVMYLDDDDDDDESQEAKYTEEHETKYEEISEIGYAYEETIETNSDLVIWEESI